VNVLTWCKYENQSFINDEDMTKTKKLVKVFFPHKNTLCFLLSTGENHNKRVYGFSFYALKNMVIFR